jgi:hypothetical protein
MLPWRRQGRPVADERLEPGGHPILRGEAFDDLTRAVGSCTSRRGALKILLLGITGVVLTPEVLAACTSPHSQGGGSPTPSPSPSRTSTSSPPPLNSCLPDEREKCCTQKQLKNCERTTTDAFVKAAHACKSVCADKHSPQCQACVTAAAHHALQAYAGCTAATCLKPVPAPPASPTPTSTTLGILSAQPLLAAVHPTENDPVLVALGQPPSCNLEKLGKCRTDKATVANIALVACALGACTNPAVAPCAICTSAALAKYAYELSTCIRDYGCAGLSFCSDGDVCCDVGFTGCSGPAGKACCAGQEKCCGGTCCSPGIEFCCEQTCCAHDDACCNGHCIRKCVPPFVLDPATCLCTCPPGSSECGDTCCPAGQSCENGVCTSASVCPPGQLLCNDRGLVHCVDPQTDRYNCNGCGNICPEFGPCCNGHCPNVHNDNYNCGACNNYCGPGWICCGGTCYQRPHC